MDLQHNTLTQKVSIGIFTVSLVMIAGMSSSFAMNHGEKENDDHRGMHHEMMKNMTPEEREAHFEERFEKMTQDMSADEKAKIRANHDEMVKIHEEISALEKPENWDTLSKEERDNFLEKAGIDTERMHELREEMPHPKMEKMQKKMQGMKKEMKDMKGGLKEARNFIRKAKKAKHFKKNLWKKLKAKKEFRDEAKMKHKDAILFLQQRGILKGYDDGNFQPEKEINRAESIKVLLEALGEGPSTGEVGRDFSDVKSSDWFAGYVTKAKARNIIKGYKDGTFQPAKTVNQAELLKVAFESFGIDLSDYEVSDLPETVSTDAWFAVYFQYALDNELLDEEDVNPAQGMTRDAFSSVVSRLIQQQEAL